MSELARELIAECQRTQSTYLDLGNCGLTDLNEIPELFECTHLETLICSNRWHEFGAKFYPDENVSRNNGKNNTLSSLPHRIIDLKCLKKLICTGRFDESWSITDITPLSKLTNLIELDLAYNQIKDLSPLTKLKHLTKLRLVSNKISELNALSGLKNITDLYLWGNSIIDISALKNLISLEELFLNSNQIKDVSALKNLVNLSTLYLNSNQIKDILALNKMKFLTRLNLANNQIKIFPSFLKKLERLHEFDISNNPHHLYIPEFFLSTEPIEIGDYLIFPTSIKHPQPFIRYLLHFQEYSQTIKESKIIFVGDPSVGKSSLIKRLLFNTFDKDSKTTEKIEIHHNNDSFFLPPEEDNLIKGQESDEKLNVHFWDFGGQEIQHSLHKLFLSERCIYVVVTAPRTEDKAGEQPLEYWLELVKQYGGNSPVIVVINKIDIEANRSFKLPEGKYKDAYNTIQLPFIRTGCETGVGVDDLSAAIQKALCQLPHLHDRLPLAHFKVKEHLQNSNKEYIGFETFEEICRKKGETYGFDFNEKDIQYLARLLHDLGTIVYFSQLELADKTVLNPAWISEGMYKVITSKKADENNGILSEYEIKAILESKVSGSVHKVYTKTHEQGYIIKTLQSFELAYKSGDGKKGSYFIPRLFITDEPQHLKDFWKEKSDTILTFRYQYDTSLPSEIMARLIYRLHSYIHESMMFREGFVIKDPNTYAYIKANTFKNQINIMLTRNPETKYLLYRIREEIASIQSNFADLPVKQEVIHIHEEKEYPIDFEDLLLYKEDGRPYWIPKIRLELDPNILLGEIEIPKRDLIIKLINENKLDQVFKELEKFSGGDGLLHKLKQEFVSSISSPDVDFIDRLKSFVRSLENKATVLPTDASSNKLVTKEKIMIDKDHLFEQIDNNEFDTVFETLEKNKTLFSGYQDLRDRFIHDNPKGTDLQKFKQSLKIFINSKLQKD